MRPTTARFCTLVAALPIAAATAGARAETSEAQFTVRVTVAERVSVEAAAVPARLLLSAEDIDRGYKDVQARYVVSSNTGRGFLLRLDPRLGLTRAVEVRGLAQLVELGEDGVEIYRSGPNGRQDLALEYRFVLAPGARPGSYELPVLLSAAPP